MLTSVRNIGNFIWISNVLQLILFLFLLLPTKHNKAHFYARTTNYAGKIINILLSYVLNISWRIFMQQLRIMRINLWNKLKAKKSPKNALFTTAFLILFVSGFKWVSSTYQLSLCFIYFILFSYWWSFNFLIQ